MDQRASAHDLMALRRLSDALIRLPRAGKRLLAVGLDAALCALTVGDLYHELLHKLHAPGVLIYGAGAAGQQLAAGLLKMSDQRLVGFIDDNAALQGRSLDGTRIHTPAELAEGLPPAGSAGGLGASGHGRAGCRPRQPARNGVLERAASR